MKKKFWFSCLLLALFFCCNIGIAQETINGLNEKNEFTVRPFRIGVKVGFPNLVGGNLEYVAPILGKKLASNADYAHVY